MIKIKFEHKAHIDSFSLTIENFQTTFDCPSMIEIEIQFIKIHIGWYFVNKWRLWNQIWFPHMIEINIDLPKHTCVDIFINNKKNVGWSLIVHFIKIKHYHMKHTLIYILSTNEIIEIKSNGPHTHNWKKFQ